jgi:hypothetical protein
MLNEMRPMLRKPIALFLVAGCTVLLLASSGFGQAFPLGVLPTPPSSTEPLDVYVWTMESVFHVGDPLEIHLSVSRPAFLYLFDLQPDGLVRLLFPNAFSPNNYVPGTAFRIPDGSYELLAQPPAGIEELLVFATLVPLPLPFGSPTDPFPLIAASPQEAIDQLVTLLSAMDPSLTWALGWTAIQIVGEPAQPQVDAEPVLVPPMPGLPPFAGSPGGSWYTVGGAWYQGVPADGWYWYYGIDQRWHLCWVYEM